MSFFKHFLQVARVLLVNFLSSLACIKLCSLSSFLWNDFQSSCLPCFSTQLLQTSLLCLLHLQSVLTCTNPLRFFKEHCANATPVHCCGMYRIFPPHPHKIISQLYLLGPVDSHIYHHMPGVISRAVQRQGMFHSHLYHCFRPLKVVCSSTRRVPALRSLAFLCVWYLLLLATMCQAQTIALAVTLP